MLDDLVGGDVLDAAALDTLILEASEEDLFLDYKSGQQREEKLKQTIRKWVTGFANADGGTLIVGVTEPKKASGLPREVDGVRAPSGSPLEEWATRVLADLAGAFSPPPCISSVKHPKGQVLVIAVRRAQQLIPYAEGTKIRYAMRIGESTVDVPEFLITDLLLGRRNHPVLEVRAVVLDSDVNGTRDEWVSPLLRVTIDNLGFVTAEDVEIGLVSWSWARAQQQPTSHLLQFLDMAQPPAPCYDTFGKVSPETWGVRRIACRPSGGQVLHLKAFEYAMTDWVPVGRFPPGGGGHFSCGLYVMPKGSMPDWYEVYCKYTQIEHEGLRGTPKVERLYDRKPVLRWGYP